ncbi:AlpA family transcriptional regulator [uncultured Rothia sp.]|uniref:helix-turn-helix transcriptional regulator n=1 Tax=uncultured Rothia sp. TaxID=316088 RepID=UPI0025F539FE|nr:helix-turn-helix domain-containing protein [uncultured Rothia sp.]
MLTIPNEGLTIWSPDELADNLGISPRTLAAWRKARTGPAYIKGGGRIYYTSAAVTAWLSRLPVTHTTN